MQQNTREHIHCAKHCGGELGNELEACQVLDYICERHIEIFRNMLTNF